MAVVDMVDRLSATRGDPSVRTQLDTGERRRIDPALWLGNRKKRRAPSSAACQRILACPGEIYSTLPLGNYSNDLLAGYRHWLDHCLPYLRHQHCLMLLKRDSPGRTQRQAATRPEVIAADKPWGLLCVTEHILALCENLVSQSCPIS